MYKFISACLIAVCFFVMAADAYANYRQPKRLNCNTQHIFCGGECWAYHQCLSGPGGPCTNQLQALCDCETANDPGYNCNNIPNVPFVPKSGLDVDAYNHNNSTESYDLIMQTLE